jgi:hypothetical protein
MSWCWASSIFLRNAKGPFQSLIYAFKLFLRCSFQLLLQVFDVFFTLICILLRHLDYVMFAVFSFFVVLNEPETLILSFLSHKFIKLLKLLLSFFEFILKFGEISLEC